MSHFTVLVIGDNVRKQLQPYHEFECTGIDDEYVQTFDKTEEYLEEFNNSMVTRYKSPDGNLYTGYEDNFYREVTPEEKEKLGGFMGSGCGGGLSWDSRDWGDGKGYRGKIHQVPEGFVEVEMPRSETESFADYCKGWHGKKILNVWEDPSEEHKYGYVLVDGGGKVIRAVDRTNPNSHWDWYQVGGSWAGFFDLKHGGEGIKGESGLFGSRRSKDGVDVLRKKDIDFEGMRKKASDKAVLEHNLVHTLLRGEGVSPASFLSWRETCVKVEASYGNTELREDGGFPVSWAHLDESLKAYADQPVKQVLTRHRDSLPDFLKWSEDDKEAEIIQLSREQYAKKAADKAFMTFALVKDGKWYQRGNMGWWASVSDENPDWENVFNRLVDAADDEDIFTLVDCHI